MVEKASRENGRKNVRDPHRSGVVGCLLPQKETEDEAQQESDANSEQDAGRSATSSHITRDGADDSDSQADRESVSRRPPEEEQNDQAKNATT